MNDTRNRIPDGALEVLGQNPDAGNSKQLFGMTPNLRLGFGVFCL